MILYLLFLATFSVYAYLYVLAKSAWLKTICTLSFSSVAECQCFFDMYNYFFLEILR